MPVYTMVVPVRWALECWKVDTDRRVFVQVALDFLPGPFPTLTLGFPAEKGWLLGFSVRSIERICWWAVLKSSVFCFM